MKQRGRGPEAAHAADDEEIEGVTSSLWDTPASGQAKTAGGIGTPTTEMQTAKTFLDAGGDFVGETKNGPEDISWVLEGKDYPRLWWEAQN